MHTLQTLAFSAALLFAGIAQAQVAGPSITFAPSAPTVAVGASFTVNVNITGVIDLYDWELDMVFSPATRVSSTAQASGPFFGGQDLFIPGTVNAGTGSITSMASTLFGPTGVSGNGTIATLTFTALNVGQATFSFSRVLLGNSDLDPIFISNANWNSGTVTVVPEPATPLLAALGLGLTLVAARRRRTASTAG